MVKITIILKKPKDLSSPKYDAVVRILHSESHFRSLIDCKICASRAMNPIINDNKKVSRLIFLKEVRIKNV